MKNQTTLLQKQNEVQNYSREVDTNLLKTTSERNPLIETLQILFFNLYDAKLILSLQYFFQMLTNVRVINRIFDKTFEKIDSFQN